MKPQTPSTGLRHPSLEEGAGKRCSECAKPLAPGQNRHKRELINTREDVPLVEFHRVVGYLVVKLQALVYDILPSTTAVFSYAIGSRKLSANEQFFVGAQWYVCYKQLRLYEKFVL